MSVQPSFQVFLDTDDIINILIYGKLNRKSISEILNKVDPIVNGLTRHNKPILVLADITHFTTSDLGARLYGSTHLKRRPVTKLAIVCRETTALLITKLLIRAAGKLNKTRFFSNGEAAMLWLKNDRIP